MIIRNNNYGNDIIFIDGMSGVGKALIAPLVSLGNNVENQKVDEGFEYLCILNHLNLLSEEDAANMLKIFSDKATYNSYVSREINLRYHDVTSIFRSSKKYRYLKNIFLEDKGDVVKEILKNKPKLNIISNSIFQVSKPLVKAFDNRLKILLLVRNPVYFLKDWASYLPKIGNDPKDLCPTVGNKGEYPWYAKNIDKYKKLKPFEKAISCLISLNNLQIKMEKSGLFNEKNLLIIPYESFILESGKWVDNICNFLKLDNSKELKKYLPKIGCPRDSLDESNYKSKKWRKLSRKITLEERQQKNNWFIKKDLIKDLDVKFYQKSLLEIKSNSSTFYFKKFIKIVENYTNKYYFNNIMPWE